MPPLSTAVGKINMQTHILPEPKLFYWLLSSVCLILCTLFIEDKLDLMQQTKVRFILYKLCKANKQQAEFELYLIVASFLYFINIDLSHRIKFHKGYWDTRQSKMSLVLCFEALLFSNSLQTSTHSF